MRSLFKIALRNLRRYTRRTLLTSLLIVVGVVMVLLFSGLAGSFKSTMIGLITDSGLGHMQIHRRGFVASIDSLPLNLNMSPEGYAKVLQTLEAEPEILASAPRIKLGGMLSNYMDTTSVRISAVDPDRELAVSPGLSGRLIQPLINASLLAPGQVIIPERLARGLNIEPGQNVVLVATNRDGSVNGGQFEVVNLIEDVLGPQGRDAYMHIDDARTLLRMDQQEVTEVILRVRDFQRLDRVAAALESKLAGFTTSQGAPAFELHTWAKLSPFANIANMIDVLTITVKIVMIAIVLISVLNVMLMSVFERVREIGTMSAMGTAPRTILGLFVIEGGLLGLFGSMLGAGLGLAALAAIKAAEVSISFARMDNLVLRPSIDPWEVAAILGIVVLVAVLAALQPAWKASRMDPVQALGHV
ncbi:MAG TPA: ABC transporter permease [Desulfonatronum sp.]|nr:ABC transporter permease [Desulfonatronum sp.]